MFKKEKWVGKRITTSHSGEFYGNYNKTERHISPHKILISNSQYINLFLDIYNEIDLLWLLYVVFQVHQRNVRFLRQKLATR